MNLTGMTCSKCANPLRPPALIYDGIEAGRFDLRLCKKCWMAEGQLQFVLGERRG